MDVTLNWISAGLVLVLLAGVATLTVHMRSLKRELAEQARRLAAAEDAFRVHAHAMQDHVAQLAERQALAESQLQSMEALAADLQVARQAADQPPLGLNPKDLQIYRIDSPGQLDWSDSPLAIELPGAAASGPRSDSLNFDALVFGEQASPLKTAPAPPPFSSSPREALPPSAAPMSHPPAIDDAPRDWWASAQAEAAASPKDNFRRVPVFFGTDRASRGTAKHPRDTFGNERGQLVLGLASVSIPFDHEVGEVERPRWYRFEFSEDPTKHMVLLEVQCLEETAYFQRLNSTLVADAKPSTFLFIHGYNVTFEDAALRSAQIAVDIGLSAVPILYSWPSQGGLATYTVDEANADWTRANLLRFIEALADKSQADEIVVIAHSMGSRPATWALETLFRNRPELKSRFRELVLAAPDIDADVFKRDILPALTPLHNKLTLYASSKDRALMASRVVHGSPRAGDSGEAILVAPGLDTVDATHIDTDFLGHSYLVSERPLLMDLATLLGTAAPRAAHRSYLESKRSSDGLFWAFKP